MKKYVNVLGVHPRVQSFVCSFRFLQVLMSLTCVPYFKIPVQMDMLYREVTALSPRHMPIGLG
jgi:hypothetical protein